MLEAGRVILIAVVPVLIASLESGQVDWRVISIACAIAILRALDKFLHKNASKYQLPF